MSIKAKIFPSAAAAILVAWLGSGCGAAGAPTQDPPCERGCANAFVACLENCFDESACRDECMAERSSCSQDCAAQPAPVDDAGVDEQDPDA